MIKNKINDLKKKIKHLNLDGYIVPKNDSFFSEYAKNDRLRYISNFSGSAGLAVILHKKNYLFVDGRYTIQAQNEAGKHFKIIEIHKKLPHKIIKNCSLGFDPHLFTSKKLNYYFSKTNKLISINKNLIDEIFKFKEKKMKPFFSLSNKIVGETYQSKIKKVINYLNVNKTDYLFISAPENVAWLLNIRGYDSPTSPIPNSRLIIGKDKKIFLITKKTNTTKIIKEKKIKESQIIDFTKFKNLIQNLKGSTFAIDNQSCSVFAENIIKSKFKISSYMDPIYSLKSVKNSSEINYMIEAHKRDGLALTKFIYWIKRVNKKKITELEAQNKLETFRKKDKNYLYPSFNTIAGTGGNGAIVHYRATKVNTKKIDKKDIFLCDSGGQYKYGTTDVTRTLCFSKQAQYIKNIYTKVLKGHIAVVMSDLKKYDTGKKIDRRARVFLKKDGLDYSHGTGHGVGFFLNVHEGPQSISKYNSVKIQKGMVLSNEPGFYKKNKFGIRIENLVYVNQKNSLYFENLTLAPLEKDLINYNLLNKLEKDYLLKYHLKIYAEYYNLLNKKERMWLASLI
ncbi:M24 family metallopeptidase [Candidatus Pelagibacter sp.]|nr:M24 family metallopeptidase [Candidatus Pelagibacter sp.]